MKGKIYNLEEANRMMPLVKRIMADIVAVYKEVNKNLATHERVKKKIGRKYQTEVLRSDERVARSLARFQALIEEMEALGGSVKDYELGIVDFYGDVNGEIIYYCWMDGEDKISFWHHLDETQTSRKPMPVAVKPQP